MAPKYPILYRPPSSGLSPRVGGVGLAVPLLSVPFSSSKDSDREEEGAKASPAEPWWSSRGPPMAMALADPLAIVAEAPNRGDAEEAEEAAEEHRSGSNTMDRAI